MAGSGARPRGAARAPIKVILARNRLRHPRLLVASRTRAPGHSALIVLTTFTHVCFGLVRARLASATGGGRTYLSVATRVVVVIGEHVHVGSVAAGAAARCPRTRARAPSPWCESLRHRAAPPAIAAALPPPAAAATRQPDAGASAPSIARPSPSPYYSPTLTTRGRPPASIVPINAR